MEIAIENISKSYGKKSVLRNVSLQAKGGMCIGLLGSNGSGKSTLLSILAGVQGCNSGSFLYDGRDLLKEPGLRRQLVGYVPQGTPLLEELTALDNLRLWYAPTQLKNELKNGVPAMLGVGEFLRVPVNKLSGGMKKRLSIACAMANRPPILLLDEPTAALDLVCKQQIFDYLQKYKAAGGCLLLTTHDVMELKLCDAWYILKDGHLQSYSFDGDVEKLMNCL